MVITAFVRSYPDLVCARSAVTVRHSNVLEAALGFSCCGPDRPDVGIGPTGRAVAGGRGHTVVLRKSGEGNEALAAQRKANELWKELDDKAGQTRELNNKGLVHLDSGEHATALDCFRQALELVSTTGD